MPWNKLEFYLLQLYFSSELFRIATLWFCFKVVTQQIIAVHYLPFSPALSSEYGLKGLSYFFFCRYHDGLISA